jgi:beta-mannosidase
MARKFYAPILVSALENIPGQSADIFVTSDVAEPVRAKLTWNVTDLSGQSLAQDSMHLDIAPRKSEKIKTLSLQDAVQKNGATGILTWLSLEAHGKIISENLVMLALPKELKLSDPGFSVTADQSGDTFVVTLKSEKPALWTWLELADADAKYSDNFFHVTKDMPRRIEVTPATPLQKDDFLKQLRVRSLFDTYNA